MDRTPVQGKSAILFALPKSGSTAAERVMRALGYIDLPHSLGHRSVCVRFDAPVRQQLQGLFRYVRGNRPVFAKVHIPFDPLIESEVRRIGLVGMVQIRDVRDALVSRYHHVIATPRHRHHASLRDLPEAEGIRRSFFGEHAGTGDDPIIWFSKWVSDWCRFAPYPILKYEDLVRDTNRWASTVINILGRDPSEGPALAKVLLQDREQSSAHSLRERIKTRGSGLSTFRRGKVGGWRDVLDQEAIDLVKQHANDALVAGGYESDDRW
jgi:hypothetical protein